MKIVYNGWGYPYDQFDLYNVPGGRVESNGKAGKALFILAILPRYSGDFK